MNRFAGLALSDSDEEDKAETSRPSSRGSAAKPAGKKKHKKAARVAASVSDDAADDAAPLERPLERPLVWIDLEMTGLQYAGEDKDSILEIAVIITDGRLVREVEGPVLALHASDEVLGRMDEWNTKTHGASGLTERCRESTLTVEEAEAQVLSFVREHTTYQGALLAGNSVHTDLAFLRAWMPRLAEHLHYRIVDVSTVMELAWRWNPGRAKKMPRKKAEHRALSDIRESIEELRYWRRTIFTKECQ